MLKFSEVTGLEERAKRYVAQGLASYGRIPMGELRPPYEQDQHDIEVEKDLMREDRENFRRLHPELAPRPNSGPIGRHPAYSRQRVEGWGVM